MLGLGLRLSSLAKRVAQVVLGYPLQETGDKFINEAGTDTITLE